MLHPAAYTGTAFSWEWCALFLVAVAVIYVSDRWGD